MFTSVSQLCHTNVEMLPMRPPKQQHIGMKFIDFMHSVLRVISLNLWCQDPISHSKPGIQG